MKKERGIGIYSSSQPDKRDRLRNPGDTDTKSGNENAKRRPISESTMLKDALDGPGKVR